VSSGVTQETDSRYGDAALSLAGLAGAALSAVLVLSAPAAGPGVGKEAQVIAQVSFASSDIRRRPARSLSWDDISHGAEVREQDSIFVPPGAGAQITFVNGSRLELDENSLVVLEAPPLAAPRVGLKKGGLSGATRGQGIEIESANGKTSLASNTEARVDLRETGPRVEVFAGQAKVVASGGVQTVAANQVGAVAAGGKFDAVLSYRVTLKLPERNQHVFYRGAPTPVALSWAGEVPEGALLEVARDRGFGFVVHSVPAVSSDERFAPTEPGIYWWRIADGSGSALSEARRLTVIEDVPPVTLAPRPREVVWQADGRPLSFAWAQVTGAGAYRLELAADAQFQTVLAFATVSEARATLDHRLDEGTYYWRVRVDDAEHSEASFSRTAMFRLIHKALPSAPELMNPEIEVEPAPEPK
jgi:hypothetical protein